MISGSRNEAETHVLEHGGAGVSYGRYDKDPRLVGSFSLFQRCWVVLAGVEKEQQAESLANEHGEGLHVRVEKFLIVSAFSHSDGALELVG